MLNLNYQVQTVTMRVSKNKWFWYIIVWCNLKFIYTCCRCGSNDTFTTGETLTFSGGNGVATTVSNDEITITGMQLI